MGTDTVSNEGLLGRFRQAFREHTGLGAFSKAGLLTAQIPWIWVILGIGVILRFITLGRQSLWLDEAISYWIVNRPLPQAFEIISEIPRPLHYVVLHVMVLLGGEEWLLRLPSALAGLGSLALIYALGIELFDRNTGLLTATILAFSPFHIWYSQEARFYSMLAFFGLAAVWFAVRGLRRNHPLDWILFGVFEGLTLATESGGIWLVFALNFASLLVIRFIWRTHRIFGWAASQAIALLIYLPILPLLVETIGEGRTLWIPPATFTQLGRTIADFTSSFMRTALEARLAIVILGVGMAIGARRILQEIHLGSAFTLVRYILLFSWFAVPVGLSFLLSQRYVTLPFFSYFFNQDRSVFLTRNLILASFPLYFLLARSLILARKPWRAVVLASLILLNLFAYIGNSILDRKEDYRSAAAVIETHFQEGDLILFAPPFLETPFAYYYYPHEGLLQVGYDRDILEDGVISENLRQYYLPPPNEAVRAYKDVWLVYNVNEFQPDEYRTREFLESWGKPVESWKFEGVTVKRYISGD